MLGVLIMSALLGAASFGCGMLPLAVTFSRTHLAWLSTLGTGLLLGTALGVTIPEGIEAILEAPLKDSTAEPPVNTIALALLGGFVVMLAAEQLLHAHAPSAPRIEFDAELSELEGAAPRHGVAGEQAQRAVPLTLGLAVHALADGLALGAAARDDDGGLGWIVFLALLVHKAPTALALTTSLLATSSLTREQCRTHLAVFSAATPVGAIAAYALFAFLGTGQAWVGATLLFSGGTFLYVATVLQPVTQEQSADGGPAGVTRVLVIAAGMFTPWVIGHIIGHEH
ncbi:Zinc/iron permease [Schizophyllum commune Tattone D]|nr:Zinc/iron permease [Schizophyllum commune Tattone D]